MNVFPSLTPIPRSELKSWMECLAKKKKLLRLHLDVGFIKDGEINLFSKEEVEVITSDQRFEFDIHCFGVVDLNEFRLKKNIKNIILHEDCLIADMNISFSGIKAISLNANSGNYELLNKAEMVIMMGTKEGDLSYQIDNDYFNKLCSVCKNWKKLNPQIITYLDGGFQMGLLDQFKKSCFDGLIIGRKLLNPNFNEIFNRIFELPTKVNSKE